MDFQWCKQFWVHMLRQPTAKIQQNMWNLLGHPPVSDLCSPWHFSVGKGRRFFFGDARISRFCLRAFRRVKPLRCVWRNRETPRNWWNVWVLFLHGWFSVKKHWQTLVFWVKILRNVLVLQVKFIQGFPFWFWIIGAEYFPGLLVKK